MNTGARWRRFSRAVLGAEMLVLLVAGAAWGAEPTAKEQLFVYEVNRARSDPSAWALEMGIDQQTGGDGQPADLTDVEPRPPLALNEALVGSSRFHADEMAVHNYFAHESEVTGDWPNKMARDAGYPLLSTLPDGTNNIESLACGSGQGMDDMTQPVNAIKLLLVDEGFENLGHRLHLLGQDFNDVFVEVGAGFASNASADCRNYWAFQTGLKDFVEVFLTGVVFDDLDGNELYDAGEGLAGVTIRAAGSTVVTNAAGGWSIPVPDGTHTVQASGGGFGAGVQLAVDVAGVNREVDFVAGRDEAFVDFEPVPVPEPGALAAGCAGLAALCLLAWRRRPAGGG